MSRWKRWVGAGFAMVVFWAGSGVAPAQAGGPTSVLLSAPGIPKVVATGYDDPRYAELTDWSARSRRRADRSPRRTMRSARTSARPG